MRNTFAILLLEDNERDADLIRSIFVSSGLTVDLKRVGTGKDFESALQAGKPDVIISDFSLPAYNGHAALGAAKRLRPETPFIFYSGTIGEECAIETLKLGATDYVLKDKPGRLIPAIQRAFESVEQRQRQKEADEKITAQAQLLDLATDAIIVQNLEDRIEFWNRGAERLYGFTRDEVLGKKFTDFLPAAALEVFKEAKRLTLEYGEWQGEKEHLTKHGKTVVVMSRWTVVRNQFGQPERILAINSDITEKKRLEKQFLRAQRLESVGTLASGVAHDLNNILAPILLACDVLKDVQPTQEAADMMEMASKSAERGAGVVNQLLTFVRGGEGKRMLLQTNNVLNEIFRMLKKSLPNSITCQCEIEPDLYPIKADGTQLHQVLMNLYINARDAMPTGGKLNVKATNMPEGFVLIRVEDTGTGMPPEILENIFDPFFTTKEPGKGTGLGLSTVLGIVKSHEGKLKVESQVGLGTAFEIFLPAAKAGRRNRTGDESAPGAVQKKDGEPVVIVETGVGAKNRAKAHHETPASSRVRLSLGAIHLGYTPVLL